MRPKEETMKTLTLPVTVFILVLGTGLAQTGTDADTTAWTGWITDSSCGERGARESHATCAARCVKEQGAKYALYTPDTKILILSDQEAAAKIGAGKVRVTGRFDSTNNTIVVTSIERTAGSSGSPNAAAPLVTAGSSELAALLKEAAGEITEFARTGGSPRDSKAPYKKCAEKLWQLAEGSSASANAREIRGAALAYWIYGYETDRAAKYLKTLSPEEREATGIAIDRNSLAIARITRDRSPLFNWGNLDPEWITFNAMLSQSADEISKAAKTDKGSADLKPLYQKWASKFWQYREDHPGTQKASGATHASLAYRIFLGETEKVDGFLKSSPDKQTDLQGVIGNLSINAKITNDYAPVITWQQALLQQPEFKDLRPMLSMSWGRTYQQMGDFERARSAYRTSASESSNPAAGQAVERLLQGLDKIAVGSIAPTFTAKDLGGTEVSLEKLKGKVVLVNVAATYCFVCRSEMPALREMYKKYKDRGLTIVSVMLDREPEPVEKMLKASPAHWPHILAGPPAAGGGAAGITSLYIPYGTPTYYVVDRNGKLAAQNVSLNKLTEVITKALAR
jgi:thiol-disulfide isomerase/thioredoxin